MTIQKHGQRLWLVVGLILVGIVSRLVPHPWNATPLTAIALFGGTYLPKRWAILSPLAIVALSDAFLGWHSTIPFTWGAFAVTGLLGWWIRVRLSATRILAGSLLGSVIFFVVTNFGVWAVEAIYPRTLAGLWQCYVAGLPFFRNMLAGDLIYTAALFGMFAAIMSLGVMPAGVRSK
ncbi:MAG: hypothetical protein HY353_02820 [Candidatus Omnitrophica bacterium]|nr:hypothetical protein [Candidatus Omnitrophota bacterium]